MIMLSKATSINLSQTVDKLPLYLIFLLTCSQQTLGSSTLSPIGCVCPGDKLTYECTVTRRAQTIWNGSTFNCPNRKNQITLIDNRIWWSLSGQRGICTNATIEGWILSTGGNNYTSQLSITVTPDTAGKTVLCLSDNGTTTRPIFSSVIPTIGRLSSPDKLQISNVDISPRRLTFEWSPVVPDCHAIQYDILTSNCGSCPTTTNHTNATCTDVPTTNSSLCTFAVQTVCGNVTGNASDPIRVNTDILYPMEYLNMVPKADTNRVYIASIVFLSTALLISTVVSITAITTILRRTKAQLTATLEHSNRAERSTLMEPLYENVTGPSPSASVTINITDNVAYGHTNNNP